MLKILANEIARLRREESGVALMMTLSIVLLLYILCAGVYSIGETVRQKIEIQNAADAAAYSAAVVEADGLNRMALINRAMSWTYIQLTNMQIDYITYKWLELVVKRFDDDREMCEKHNADTDFIEGESIFPFDAIDGLFIQRFRCNRNNKLKEPGTGWFCGVASARYGMDMVHLNRVKGDDAPVPIQEIRNVLDNEKVSKAILDYEALIPEFKKRIVSYNALLHLVNSAMRDSMYNTAMATLYLNLPRKPDSGDIDTNISRDFLAFVDVPYGGDPYQKVAFDDGTEGANIFSPLYNTELDERMFLAMADGEAHDRLVDCFGRSVDDELRCVGLDQWFVRSYTNEIFKTDAKFEMELPNDKYEPTNENSLKSPGICRVYKHANRVHLGGDLGVYRANHRGVENDDLPSCVNTHALCPEQCKSSPDSIALYADYEWSAGRYICKCLHLHRGFFSLKKGWRWYHQCHVHDYDVEFINRCTVPEHASNSLGSHTRDEYGSCWTDRKRLMLYLSDIPGSPLSDIEWLPQWVKMLGLGLSLGMEGLPLDCLGNIIMSGGVGNVLSPLTNAIFEMPNVTNDRDWQMFEGIVRYSNKRKPNGFSRIYGDDKELMKDPNVREAYAGVPALPWILNRSYYNGGGTITVGFARRQRNPWTFLLNAVEDVFSDDKIKEDGIYSAFDPVRNGYIVAFSAARAGHLFHPTPSQSAYGAYEADPGEYEVRYDAVCDDEDPSSMRFVQGPNAGRRFKVDESVPELCSMRVGCVCGDYENSARFARCWNLCETDWDATLLPLRYSHAPLLDEWDSYANSAGRIGAAKWKNAGPDDLDSIPFVDAARRKWTSVVPGSGVEIDGADLLMREPMTTLGRGRESVKTPYSSVEIEKAFRVNGSGVVSPAGLIQERIL